jgi:hypothetical protein
LGTQAGDVPRLKTVAWFKYSIDQLNDEIKSSAETVRSSCLKPSSAASDQLLLSQLSGCNLCVAIMQTSFAIVSGYKISSYSDLEAGLIC